MAAAAELAMAEVNASGQAANTYASVRGDSTCVDAAAATAAAERMITAEGVKGIIGGDCSGVTRAVLTNVAMPNGIVMVSPSATSPALTADPDNGLFFRTSPSDAREGEVMADILTEKGIKSIALTYSNSDYGKGLAEAISAAFIAKGGTVTINAAHDDGKADYSAEVAALAAAGGDLLVVAGYLDQGGKGIIQASLDTGAFSTFSIFSTFSTFSVFSTFSAFSDFSAFSGRSVFSTFSAFSAFSGRSARSAFAGRSMIGRSGVAKAGPLAANASISAANRGVILIIASLLPGIRRVPCDAGRVIRSHWPPQ